MYGGFVSSSDAFRGNGKKPAAESFRPLPAVVVAMLVNHLLHPQCADRIRDALESAESLLSKFPPETVGSIVTAAGGDAIIAFFESITRQVAEKVK